MKIKQVLHGTVGAAEWENMNLWQLIQFCRNALHQHNKNTR